MRFSKAIIPIALCIMLLSLAVPAQRRKGRSATPRKPIVVTSIDLEAFKGLITQQREHPLLINFWATYCDPCREEFPDLVKIDRDYRPRSLEFVTISLDDVTDIKTGVPKFLDFGLSSTMAADLPPSSRVAFRARCRASVFRSLPCCSR